MAKSLTYEEREERLGWVEIEIAKGTQVVNIVKEGAVRYEVTERTIRNWIAKVDERWCTEADSVEQGGPARRKQRGRIRAIYDHIIRESLKAKNYNAAIRALEGKAKFDGLEAPTKVEHGVAKGTLADLMATFFEGEGG